MSDRAIPTTESPAVLVRAGPGGGKTAALVTRVRQTAAEGLRAAQTLCLVLDDAAVERLQQRLLEAAPGPRAALPAVLTYERVARRALVEAHGAPQGRFLDPLAERLLVGRALRDTATQARRFRNSELRESARFRDDVADFIAELKRHKLTPEFFRKSVLPGLPDQEALEDLAEVYERYQELLQQAGMFDLRGLLWLALIALEENPVLAASWRGRYALVLADDLQDATPLHLELLAALIGPQTELVGACEPAQAVYRFRGAVGEPGPWLARYLPGREIREIAPSPPGGLPTEVAEVAKRFAETYGLNSRPPGRGEAVGEVAYALYRSWEEEKEALGEAIVEALSAGECAPEEIAVLTRSAKQAEAVAGHLALRGIPTGGTAGTPGEWPARRLLQDVLTVLSAVQGKKELPPGAGRTRREAVNQAFCRLVDLIAAPEEQSSLFDLGRQPGDLLQVSLPAACPAAQTLQTQFTALGTEATAEALLKLGKALLSRARLPLAMEIRGALIALLRKIAEVNEQILRLGEDPLSLDETETVLAGARAPQALPAPAVSVLTAHESRGRRFRRVWVAGLQEETFPAPFVISRLLSPSTALRLREKVRRVLGLPEEVLPFAGLGEAPSEAETEEQRLFYTCLTRSSERLVLSAHLEEGGAEVTPSPYLAAVLPADFALQDSGPMGNVGGFSCVFECLAPTSPQGRATHEGCPVRPCPRGEARGRRAPRQVEARGLEVPGVPVLREVAVGLELSPSSLGEYLRCPRRFLLGPLLQIAPEEEADVRTYGSAVHKFLREYNRPAPELRTSETAHQLLEEALEKVRGAFTSPLAAELYRRLAHAALKVYLTTDLACAEALLAEEYLRFDLPDGSGGQHRFVGKLDLVAALEGGVAVVDYKTGTVSSAKKLREGIPLTEEDVRAGKWQVQLPMYALAWEAQLGHGQVRQVCLQSFSAAEDCKRSCIQIGEGAKETETLTREDLTRFRAMLAKWATQIKQATEFCGNAPEEGCLPFQGGCPFVGICDEAETF